MLQRKLHETKSRHSDYTPYFYCSICSKAPPKSNLQDLLSSSSHFVINLRVAPRSRVFILSTMFLSFKVCNKKLDLPRSPCITICVWGKLVFGVQIQFCLIKYEGGFSCFYWKEHLIWHVFWNISSCGWKPDFWVAYIVLLKLTPHCTWTFWTIFMASL